VWNTLNYVTVGDSTQHDIVGHEWHGGCPSCPAQCHLCPSPCCSCPTLCPLCLVICAMYIWLCFHWTVYNITCGDVLNYCRPTKWSERTLEHLAALSTQEALCYRLWVQSETVKCQRNVQAQHAIFLGKLDLVCLSGLKSRRSRDSQIWLDILMLTEVEILTTDTQQLEIYSCCLEVR